MKLLQVFGVAKSLLFNAKQKSIGMTNMPHLSFKPRRQKTIVRNPKEVIIKLYKMLREKDNTFYKVAIPTQNSIEFVNVETIIRCEADGNYTKIYLEDKKPLFVSKTLKQIEEILADSILFFRPHNSHIVSLKFLKAYRRGTGGSLEMEDGVVIPVSRSRKIALNQLI